MRTLACGSLVALTLLGCQDGHTVKLELGGDADSISQGFLCRVENATGDLDADDYLFERGHDLATGTVTFSLVVDVVALGEALPGCLPEEILGVCRDADSCPIAARFCAPVVVEGPRGKRLAAASEAERGAFVSKVAKALHALPRLFQDAPDGPVVVRAVTTVETCEALGPLRAGSGFRVERLMGCAYSCPVVLDDLDTALRLGFATSDSYCAATVRGCAAYPGNAASAAEASVGAAW